MKICRVVSILVSLTILLFGFNRRTLADESAALTGRITDSQGLVVAGVKVEATNVNTNITFSGETNGDGLYRISEIPPGVYRVIVQKPGFVQVVKPGVELHVQDDITLNFALRVGSVSETITVEGGAPLVNTESAAVSTVIDRNLVSRLPLNGRSFNTLLQLTPGAVIAPSNNISPGQFSINGQRANANYFTVDGVSVNFGLTALRPAGEIGQSGGGGVPAFTAYGGTSSLVSVDSLQEFRVQTSSFAPEYGRSPGGQVSIETRPGTNDFHGDAFDYFRNTVLDANNWFNNATIDVATGKSLARAPEHQNDFGGVLGGPIIRNKTFFFLSYEGLRLGQPQTTVITVPSPSFLSTHGGIVPAAAPYLNAYPRPNGIDFGNGTAQFIGSYSNVVTQDAGSLRIDHMFNHKWAIFGRFNDAPSQLRTRTDSLSEVDTSSLDTKTFTLGLTGALTSRLTNSFRGNYSLQRDTGAASLDSFGGATPPDSAVLLPTPLSIAHANSFFETFDTDAYRMGSTANNQESQINLIDDVVISKGRHQLKLGADYRRLGLRIGGVLGAPAYLAFSTEGFAANSSADLFFNTVLLPSEISLHSVSLYGQDAWRIGSRLVLTYGVRWEFNPAPSGQNGTILASWINTDNPQATALAPPGTSPWKNTYDNFAPRVGIAYRISSKGDFVVRGGWGVFYDLGTADIASSGQFYPNQSSLFRPSVTLPINNVAAVTPPPPSLNPPYPSNRLIGFSSTLELPRSYQWNLALEKSLWDRQAVSVTYLGQVGRRLLRSELETQPNSNFMPNTSFRLIRNGDTSDYHALQVQYRKPLFQGLQALLNYTWSHSIDTNSDDSSSFVPSHFIFSPGSDRGSSAFDVRHNFSGVVTYSLPYPKKLRLLEEVSKDWSIDAVVQARTGFPINVTTNTVPIPGIVIATRPDVVPGVPFWLSDATVPGGKRLNSAAFSIPQQPRQGTLGRNRVPGLGLTQVDLSVGRRFALTERIGLQFRGDLFNVFNHPNFTNPQAQIVANPTSGNVEFVGGGIASTMLNQGLGGLNALYQIGGPRSVQLSLKLQF